MASRGSIALALAAALVATACGSAGGARSDGDPLVVASLYPLAFVAERVAAGHATVEDLTPAGAEPHDLELSPGQVGLLHRADLILYIGAGFQPALEDLVAGVDAMTVDVLDAVEVESGPAEDHQDEDDEDHGGADPHVWLDPQRMQEIVRVASENLGENDPANASAYRSNAAALMDELADLDTEIGRGLERCERRELVVSHEAFGYLAERYELDQIGIAGIDPEAEPAPQRLAEAVRFARAHDVTTIFFESLVSPAVAETVAREIGADTAALDPLETAPPSGDYLDAMRANLDSLRSGLGC